MKSVRFILVSLLTTLLLNSFSGHAEDIDLYSGLGGAVGLPNVLIILDTAANADANGGTATCSYIDGGTPSMAPKLLGLEQCAIYNVIYGLPTTASGGAQINMGMMFYNASGLDSSCNAVSNIGGCLIRPLSPMNAAGKAALLAWIRTWTTAIKSNGEATAQTIQEAWAYYAGNTGVSGRNYASIKPTAGCQKNFVVFIGNAYGANGGPGDGGLGSTSLAGLLAAAPGVTAAQKVNITIPSGNYNSCGAYSMGTHSEGSGLYADEWARYMYQSDLSSTIDGVQNIITYTIAALGPSCKPDYPAVLTSTGDNGGGKYFATNGDNSDEIAQALLKILNEVQAVNSVFAASSLPVSVNAQGTYLNQIYMGMFRPDANGLPRWVGNLKQYQFGYDPTTQKLSLVDSLKNPAISGAGTGFIASGAVSFWTTKNLLVQPDLGGGFWRRKPLGDGLGYDSADGELVEKGGAAQVMRLTNLLVNYATSPSSPRNLYTYCPGETGCSSTPSTLSNAANLFSTSNAAITAAKLGSASTVNVSTLTRSGTVATVTTATPHNLTVGGTATISGAIQTEYNGSFTVVTAPSPTTFTITVPEYPPLTTTGSYTASVPSTPQTILSASVAGSITRGLNTAGAPNAATATVTMVANHGYATGNGITIAGSAQTKYSGLQNITVTGLTTFTFPVVVQPVSPAGGATASAASNVTTKVKGVTTTSLVTVSVVNPGGVVLGAETSVGAAPVTVTTTTAHNFTVGNTVTLANVVDSGGSAVSQYNGNFTIVSIPTLTSFTYTTATTPISPATIAAGSTAITADFITTSKTISSLIRLGATATATTVVAHGFLVGQIVSIGGTQGPNEAGYVGSFTVVSVPTTTTFTYTVPLTPATPATGTMKVSASGVVLDRVSVINWVRGEDNFKDEPSPDTTYSTINIRPSLHGDVLHSRPVVINYGGTTGVVVFYGSNDGVYHAVNGNQDNTHPSGQTTTPGGELWGFIPSEFITKLSRMHDNSPVLKLSTTPTGIIPSPRGKDYFVDGSTGVYQKINASGTTDAAYIYLAMRRGGQLLYALDVTTPTAPQFKWTKNSSDTDYLELSQTWSSPKVAFVKGYCGGSACSSINPPTPVLIFGGGYDIAEDSEPPATDTDGRGIFIVDALDGHVVWSATYATTSTHTITSSMKAAWTVPGMTYSIPSDITLIDRTGNDGYIDRLYAVDTGGNIWRVDLEPTAAGITPDNWQVTQLAALGCNAGVCASGATPRKFFYPVDMVPTPSYDAVLVGSGDREHPLYNNLSYNVTNRFYMVKDMHTGNDATTSPLAVVTENTGITANLKDITDTSTYAAVCAGTDVVTNTTTLPYDNSLKGYYVTLCPGEKAVNAPLTVAGYTYFGTNQPKLPSPNTCSDLGVAKGYRIKPLTGESNFVIYDRGGLPPSPVAGLVTVNVNGKDQLIPFCIGCGGDPGCVGKDCKTAIGGGKPVNNVPTSRSRTYWYKESD